MKSFGVMGKWTFICWFIWPAGRLLAQSDSSGPVKLWVACGKTTSLVFSRVVMDIDRGSNDILVQKVNAAPNIVQVKAAREHFQETNLTVITADGRPHCFRVGFAADPSSLTIEADSSVSVYERVIAQRASFPRASASEGDIEFRLRGLYVEDGLFYCRLRVENSSNVPYGVEALRFYVRDRKQNRRTASQELDQPPLAIYGNNGVVEAQSLLTMVAVLPAFTIPEKKHFYIELTEKGGGRNLRLKISNRKLMKAKVLK